MIFTDFEIATCNEVEKALILHKTVVNCWYIMLLLNFATLRYLCPQLPHFEKSWRGIWKEKLEFLYSWYFEFIVIKFWVFRSDPKNVYILWWHSYGLYQYEIILMYERILLMFQMDLINVHVYTCCLKVVLILHESCLNK